MKTSNRFLALSVAALTAGASIAGAGWAADAATPAVPPAATKTAPATTAQATAGTAKTDTVKTAAAAPAAKAPVAPAAVSYATQKGMLKASDEGLHALQDIQQARVDIFEARTDAAKEKVARALKVFDKSAKTFDSLTIPDTAKAKDTGRDLLPVNVSMQLSADYKPDDAAKKALDDAGSKIKNGKSDEAIEVLRAADVQLNLTTALVPIAQTQASLKSAETDLADGKYYEANLALKAITDSIQMRDYGLNAIPQQGAAS